jgi:hypothetical protein
MYFYTMGEGCSVLHAAAWNDAPEAARALLDGGADLNARSGPIHQNEPIGWAIVSDAPKAVAALLEHGAEIRKVHRDDAEAGAEGSSANSTATVHWSDGSRSGSCSEGARVAVPEQRPSTWILAPGCRGSCALRRSFGP